MPIGDRYTGLNTAKTAGLIMVRGDTVLGSAQTFGPAKIEQSNDQRVLTVAGRRVVSVTPADATSMGVSVDALARDWADAIDVGLARGAKRRGSATQRFLVAMQGSVQSAFSRLLETIISFIPPALAALLVVLLLFWAVAAGVRRASCGRCSTG